MDQEHLTSDALNFPFPAVIGVEEAKKALMIALASDDVKTVLIQGGTGSAKTTLVRSLPGICGRSVHNLPLGTTSDQIFGMIDMEETLLAGERRIMPGILEKSDGGILHSDDVNLMDRSVLTQMLESVIRGSSSAEKEGISREYKCDATFIGTMNVSESPIPPHILDRFDICVRIPFEEDMDARHAIVKRRLDYENDPEGFASSFEDECRSVSESISEARARLPYVSISDDILCLIAELCIRSGCDGMRGDLSVTNASKAIAALDGRDSVSLDDMKEAARMCLRHRMTKTPEEGSSPSGSGGGLSEPEPPPMSSDGRSRSSRSEGGGGESGGSEGAMEDTVFSIGSTFSVIDFVSLKPLGSAGSPKGGGKHEKVRGKGCAGRYVRAEVPKGRVTDIAFDATIRVAAPYQMHRERRDLAIAIEKSDFRQKIRERRKGASILFVVDASGSMGARKRMVAVKGAVFSLLKQSYQNRDKVGLVSFRRDRAEVLLPFTKSVDFAYRKLKDMPTGGTTPLAAAILKADLEVEREMRMNPNERCYVALLTDGRANVSLSGDDALKDAMSASAMVGRGSSATWIVVDTGTGYPHLDNALRISERLNGMYLRLEELKADSLAHRISTIVGAR